MLANFPTIIGVHMTAQDKRAKSPTTQWMVLGFRDNQPTNISYEFTKVLGEKLTRRNLISIPKQNLEHNWDALIERLSTITGVAHKLYLI